MDPACHHRFFFEEYISLKKNDDKRNDQKTDHTVGFLFSSCVTFLNVSTSKSLLSMRAHLYIYTQTLTYSPIGDVFVMLYPDKPIEVS